MQNISYDIMSLERSIFKLQGFEWDLSMMRIAYKLTTPTTTIEKKNKKMKPNYIVNFRTFR